MLRRSTLRNIPLLLQPAYGAAKNLLELWRNVPSQRVRNVSCRNRAELLARPVTMDDADHQRRVKRRKRANRRRRQRSVFKDVLGVPPPVLPVSGHRLLEGG